MLNKNNNINNFIIIFYNKNVNSQEKIVFIDLNYIFI